jgi:hypothetical protein
VIAPGEGRLELVPAEEPGWTYRVLGADRGVLRIEGVVPGRYRARLSGSPGTEVSVRPGETLRLEVPGDPEPTVDPGPIRPSVRVTIPLPQRELLRGAGSIGVRIPTWDRPRTWSGERVARDGELRLSVPAGTEWIRLQPAGYRPVTLRPPADRAEWRPPPVIFETGAAMAVTVTDSDGRPVPGALVVAVQEEAGSWQQGRGDADGKLRLTGLEPDETAVVRIRAIGYVDWERAGVPPGEEVVAKLVPVAVVAVEVRHPDGLPAGLVEVEAVRVLEDGSGRAIANSRADSAGRLQLPLPPGRYRIECGNAATGILDLAPGETRTVELVLNR